MSRLQIGFLEFFVAPMGLSRRRGLVSLQRRFRVEGQNQSNFYPLQSKIQNFFKMTSEKENERKIRKLKFLQKGIYVVALFVLILLLLVQTIQCEVKIKKIEDPISLHSSSISQVSPRQ